MSHDQAHCFGSYRLVGPQGPLWRGAEIVPVPPKALAVLWTLARRAGQVVAKEALLDHVWPETVVSEGVLTSCIRLLRRVLEEDSQQPQYIATVHRVGYRFMAPVTPEATSLSLGMPLAPASFLPPRPLSSAPSPLMVGRQAELAQIRTGWTRALQGVRQTLFVTGEAGLGKTTLVEAFLAQLGPATPCWVGRGQCIEHYGAGAAYLPLLDALGRLGRGPDGAQLVTTLRQYAPTWLAQLPALCEPADQVTLQHTLQGTTRARMLRELVEALEMLTAVLPLVLVLEDLHWSDVSTVEVLALLARRCEPARLLVLGTYRPVEVIVHAHPLKTVKQELVVHGQATELPLGGLGPEAVVAYLAQRKDLAAQSREDMAAAVYRRTEGHPLFMVQMVNYLVRQAPLQAVPQGSASGAGVGGALDLEVPQGLRDLLEAQLGQLEATAQRVLEVGSVAGAEFVVASVAAGVQMAPEAVEAVCEGLARRGQFIQDRGLAAWPDGTVSGRYGFRHALYQEVVYQRLGAGRRTRLHRLLGARDEAGYGARASEIATVLAMHFERGHDPGRAVRYRQQAAEQALRRYAYREAAEHLTTALALLQTLPETPERAQLELALQMALGSAAMAAYGETAATVERAYARACTLCQQVDATSQYCAALVGLGTWYATHGQLRTARELLEQALHYGQEAHDPADHARAAVMLGSVMFLSGEFVTAQAHLEEGQRLYAPQRQRFHALASPAFGLTRLAEVLWHLGYPDQALQRSDAALHLARSVAHPWELLVALIFVTSVHQRRRDVSQTRVCAEEALALAAEHGFVLRFAQAQILHGWALVMQGHGADGMAQLQQGSSAYRARGAAEAAARYIGLEAEVYGYLGDPSAGLQRLVAVMADLPPGVALYHQAELLRLHGDLLLQIAGRGPKARHRAQLETAETCFRQALALACRQHAKMLELRAATSLSRLWQQQGKRTEARELLTPIYGWFTEGFDTSDLQEAQALLEALSIGMHQLPTPAARCAAHL